MIELNTGVPGSGKTLSMVQRLAAMIARWASHPDEARPIFVLGIPELALPHAIVPLKSVQVSKAGAPMLVPDWEEMPDGSLVIIDEAQGVFPPRSAASMAPDHVAWLNTHRHRGFDIWLTTQHPKLIDTAVRALVGRHQHYRRMFGLAGAVIYEWDACSDSLAGMKTAVKTPWYFPRKAFQWYKSAEIHTKQKFKIPLWFAIFPIGVLMMLIFFPKAYAVLVSGMTGKGLGTAPAQSQTQPQPKQGGAVPTGEDGPQIVGYVLQDARCYGFTKTGSFIPEPEKCREHVR